MNIPAENYLEFAELRAEDVMRVICDQYGVRLADEIASAVWAHHQGKLQIGPTVWPREFGGYSNHEFEAGMKQAEDSIANGARVTDHRFRL